MFQREVQKDGLVKLSDAKASFVFHRPRPGVLVVTVSGVDDGQFGTAALDEMGGDLARYAPVEIFLDADRVAGANLRVQEEWTE